MAESYSKFQWSKMSPDRSEQVVVRTDKVDEFSSLIDYAKGILPTQNPFPNDEGSLAHTEENTQPAAPTCPVDVKHGAMQWRSGVSKKTNKPYGFWSCGQKDSQGNWCKGKK